MNRWLGPGLLLALLAGALALRLPALDARPMHNDEGINALKLRALWLHGRYAYDPHEFHGPALYYAALPFVWLSPARNFDELSETTLRLTTVAFGVALILLLPLLGDGLGRFGTFAAGALLAVSPAMVFYSRYFIHEMALVCFTLLALGGAWRWWQTRRAAWAALAGAGVGLMFATKETFVLTLAALALAVVLTFFLERRRGTRAKDAARGHPRPRQPAASLTVSAGEGVRASASEEGGDPAQPPHWDARRFLPHAAVALAAAFAVWLVLFSSFFTNPHGLLDSVLTYDAWLHRAGGASPHIHPWHEYLHRLLWFQAPRGPVWTEGFILLLAGVGALAGLSGRGLGEGPRLLARFLAVYSFALLGIYSAIAYKTPWCLLNFWLGFVLLAGMGAGVLWTSLRPRVLRGALAVILLAGAVHLGWQAWRAGFVMPADRRNPYVYAQTSEGVLELTEIVERLATVHPASHAMVVKVISRESYWPLPWYLRRFGNVGWWDELPDDPFAPVILVGARLRAGLDEKSGGKWRMTGYHELRPGVFLELYVEEGLWRRYVEANTARGAGAGQ